MDNRAKTISTAMTLERDEVVIQASKKIRDHLIKCGAKQCGMNQVDHKQLIDMFELIFDVESQFASTCNPFLNVMNKHIQLLQNANELLSTQAEYTSFLAANRTNLFKPDVILAYKNIVSKFNEKTLIAAHAIKDVNSLKSGSLPQSPALHAMHEKLNKLNCIILGAAFAALNKNAVGLSTELTGNMFERAKARLALFRHVFCDDHGNLTSYNSALRDMDATIQKMTDSIKVGCAATDLFKSQVAQIAAAKAKQQQGVFQPAAPAPAKAIPPTTPGFRRAINSTGN